MKTFTSLAAVLAFLVALSGCAALQSTPPPKETEPPPRTLPEAPAPTPPKAEPKPPEPPPRAPWAEKRERAALALEATGDLARALTQWKLVRLLEPENPRWRERVEDVTRRIGEKVARLLNQGETAQRAGDSKAAIDAYLRVLALNPRDTGAAQQLRELEAGAIRSRELAKLDKTGRKQRPAEMQTTQSQGQPAADSQASYYLETGIELLRQGEYEKSVVELDKYLRSFPDDRRAKKHLTEAHVRLGQAALKTGDISAAIRQFDEAKKGGGAEATQAASLLQQAKKRMADDLYDQGVRLSRSNIEKAIKYWKEALTYDPNHVGARSQLDKAKRIQEKLKTIQ